MQVELRIRQLLRQNGIGKPNVTRIAREAKIPRRTLSRLLDGDIDRLPLDAIGRLCDWMMQQNFRADLPGDLFGARPSTLWSMLADPSDVDIYLGEYRQQRSDQIPRLWVSSADSQLSTLFIEQFCQHRHEVEQGRTRSDAADASTTCSMPLIHWFYVPCRIPPDEQSVCGDRVQNGGTLEAQRCFTAMRQCTAPRTSIMIGSQRANPLVELFVADLFGVAPFSTYSNRLPLYLYKPADAPNRIRSSFGGPHLPNGFDDHHEPGLYYCASDSNVEFCPSRPMETDSGIVIVRRDSSLNQTEMAVFGVSTAATAAMGQVLRQNPDCFWQPSRLTPRGVEVSACVCKLEMHIEEISDSRHGSWVVDEFDVVQINLDRRARRKRSRPVVNTTPNAPRRRSRSRASS